MEKLLHQTGCVRWPKNIPDSGAGGMFVYAFWTAEYNEVTGLGELLDSTQTVEADPFVACCGPDNVIALPLPDVAMGAGFPAVYPPQPEGVRYVTPADPDTRARERYRNWERDAGAPVLAAICLGSTNATYTRDAGATYWTATTKDLTRHGRTVLGLLDSVYGRRAHLVTYLDI